MEKKAAEMSRLLTNKVHRSTIDRYNKQSVLNQNQEEPTTEPYKKKERIYLVKKKTCIRTFVEKFYQRWIKICKNSHRTIKQIVNIDLNKTSYRKITVERLKQDDQKPIRKQHVVNRLGRTSIVTNSKEWWKYFHQEWLFQSKNWSYMDRWSISIEWTRWISFNGKISNVSHRTNRCNIVSTYVSLLFSKSQRLNGQSYHDQLLTFYKRGRSTTIWP